MTYQTAGLIICQGLGACCSHSASWTRQAGWALWDLKITSGNAGFLGILGSYLIFQTIWALLSADCRFYWLKIGIPFLCEAFNGRKSLDANQ